MTPAAPIGLPPAVIRVLAVGALALFGAQAWGGMVRPGAEGRLVGAAATGILLAAITLVAIQLPRLVRLAVLGAVGLAAVLASLLWAGVPLSLLDLESWGELSSGLWQGIQALPGLNVPYRGVDEWNRVAMLLGGTVATIAGVLLACRPDRTGRYAGLVVLAVLYAVPAVQIEVGEPFLEGALFALLLAAVLWGERLARTEAPLAATAVAVAALAGAVFAPALDARDPWLDYEALAQSLTDRGTSIFSWNHAYGPLDWPRDGREVLRIATKTGAYWKATTLGEFDGHRWVEVRPQGLEDDPEADRPRPRWVQDLRVSVRNLRTQQFIAAGTTIRIDRSPREVVGGAPGSFVTPGRPLRRGHAYLARAYVPRPRVLELEAAGTDYPGALWQYQTMRVPPSVGGPPAISPNTRLPTPTSQPAMVWFSGYDDQRPALGYLGGRGVGERVGTEWVRQSQYARMYALAQRLKRRSTSPYGFVREVQAFLGRGFSYSEAPPERPLPLDAFVFDDKVGYCQHFSGAMTLLLRMGGVPARVATGFSPGTLDSERGEYVVRDLDAHSWVEAYFPGYGWIPFDPTPAVAPPRAQLPALDAEEEPAADAAADAEERIASERAENARLDQGGAGGGGGGPSVLEWALLGVGLLAVCGAVAYVVVALRMRRRYGPEVAAAELARALRRTGRLARQGSTLSELEQTLRGSPEAASYVRSVRLARFGYGSATPTRAERRALRRELGSGLGLRGRLRALVALPPF